MFYCTDMWRGALLLSSLIALSSSQGITRDAVKGQNVTLVCESPWQENVVISWLTKTLGSESFSSLLVPASSTKYSLQSTADRIICGTSVCYECGGQARCTVSLTIYNLEVKDSGEYKCEMTRYSNSQQGELNFQVDVLDSVCANLSTLKGTVTCLPIGYGDEASCHAIPGCCYIEVGKLDAPIGMCIRPDCV